jgi:hypothetical protein
MERVELFADLDFHFFRQFLEFSAAQMEDAIADLEGDAKQLVLAGGQRGQVIARKIHYGVEIVHSFLVGVSLEINSLKPSQVRPTRSFPGLAVARDGQEQREKGRRNFDPCEDRKD